MLSFHVYIIQLSARFIRFLIILAASCIFPLLGGAQLQNIKFDRLGSENSIIVKGLSQNSIYCLAQDSKGFIWIGTWDGLNKYDGYGFVIYNTMNGLSHPTVNSVYIDEGDEVWAGTDNGLNVIHRETGDIVHYFHDPDNSNSLTDNFINHITRDRKGYIWISTAFGLNRFDPYQQVFTSLNFFERDADSAVTNFITRVREDQEGNLWIATRRGIHLYDPEKREFEHFKLESDPKSPSFNRSNFVQEIVTDEFGQVFAATLNGVFLIHPQKGVIHHIMQGEMIPGSISSNQVNALLIDPKGLLWIGTANGLDVYNPASGVMTGFKAGPNIGNLSNEDVRSIFRDQSGTLWIGTYKGLNKVDPSPSRFMRFQNNPAEPGSLSNNIVYAFTEDGTGKLWIGTYGGINVFNRADESFLVLKHDPRNPHSLPSNRIRTLSTDSSGFIWAGTENKGIGKLDPANGKVIRWYVHEADNPGSIPENNILSAIVDRQGRLWIGTVNRGIGILDFQSDSIRYINADKLSVPRLSDNKIWTIYEDLRGNFWVGTNKGLNRLSPGLDSAEVFTQHPDDPKSLNNERIMSLSEDIDGNFWVGTMGGGLNHFNPSEGHAVVLDESAGLPNNVVYGILDDKEGNLWISTNWGLSKFNKRNETFINYDVQDGLQGNEFNANAYFKTKAGEMYFGGMNGFNVFFPREIVLNIIPPRLAFTGFRVLNVLQDMEIDHGEVRHLNYNENFFSIEFSALDYTNPSKNMYRYKLENYDNDWIITGAMQRKAEYRKVPPGTYRFIVHGSNNDGIWNEEGIVLNIVIRPPWWGNWIFRIALVVVTILLVWSTVVFRIRTIRRKHDVERKMLSIEKQVFELEQKALRLQMNPHFMFNSLNAIQNFVLANDTDHAVNYLAKFSHLMRMILANSTASLITLKDELKALTYYLDLEQLRFDHKFEYEIIRDPQIDEEFVEIPPMLFQPFVENAIIHGLVNSPRPGKLEINIRQSGTGTLLCSIIDNGVGRENAIRIRNESGIRRQPKGMLITQERIEIFNRQNQRNYGVKVIDLKDEQGNPSGTLVEFTIQYKEI